jgi:NAD(P)-dependent dehydrogenase (short-subunit alcohol dehydrogenase family)
VVCPGSIDSPRRRARLEAQAKEEKKPVDELMQTTVGRAIPMGRVGKPEEVASIIVFLAGAQASYITGTVINVDGGLEAGLSLE